MKAEDVFFWLWMFIVWLIAFFSMVMAFSLPVQGAVQEKNCEELAMAYQQANRGDLIFVMPLQDNGAYVPAGRYAGHWAVLRPDGVYYDPQDNAEGDPWIMSSTGKRSRYWNINKGEHPPFGLIRN